MVLFLLPDSDYDPTETAVPWHALQQAGIEVQFATPDGKPAYADQRLVTQGFSILSPLLMTRQPVLQRYQAMIQSTAFQNPRAYASVQPEQYEAIIVPGGHAAGMRSMLDSKRAQQLVLHFFQANKPVAAVCHGVLLIARTIDPATGRSVLFNRTTTALPSLTMELPAWLVTAPWLGSYYRTYSTTVEAEVKAALASPSDFKHGPLLPLRDSDRRQQAGFIVQDKNYLSARWPGDCHRYAAAFVEMVQAARTV